MATKRKSSSAKAKGTETEGKKKQAKLDSESKKSYKVSDEPKSKISIKDYVVLQELIEDEEWRLLLKTEIENDYFKGIETFLNSEYSAGKEVFPPTELIFNIFNIISPKQVKVVILGQDPYHATGQAHGLCFSVPKSIAIPPSLKNIYKELLTDIPGFEKPSHGCLDKWAKQGVFLLNASLTVEAHKANSHAKCGWQTFTDKVIQLISDTCSHVVFILWGKFAENKTKLIDSSKHKVLISGHPSPLSVKHFLGCKCFSAANTYLTNNSREPIEWTID